MPRGRVVVAVIAFVRCCGADTRPATALIFVPASHQGAWIDYGVHA
jgi:hypothetical protein